MNPAANLFLVFMGGGLGSLARHLVNLMLTPDPGPRFFPFHTLSINVIGSVVIGVLAGMAGGVGKVPEPVRLLLVTGLLGGFTTYSGFSYETLMLLREQRIGAAMGYAVITVLGCLAAVWGGWTLGELASK